MCTVTIFPTPVSPVSARSPGSDATCPGFRLFCNRDEQHTRAPGEAPEIRELLTTGEESIQVLCPTDPSGGGTWVGVNSFGVAATVLNLNLEAPPTRKPHHQSRGQFVLDALKHTNASSASEWAKQAITPDSTLPFRLVIAAKDGVHLICNNGQSLTHESLGPITDRYFFTSSGLGDHIVQNPREALFHETFDGLDDQAAYEQQAAFHHHQWADKTHISIDTMRDDARTVSRTQVVIGPDQTRMAYTPTNRNGAPTNTITETLTQAGVTQEPDKNQKHARRFTWKTYALLLFASAIFQSFVTIWPQWPTKPYPQTPSMQVHEISVPRMSASGTTKGNSVTIGYRTYGPDDAPITLIALHGSPNAGPNFFRFSPALVQTFDQPIRIIAPDLPGYGRSSRWVPNYGCDAYAHYTLAFMDALKIDHAHILGYSLGGGVATRMIDLAPKRLDSVIFFGGIGDQSVEGTGDYHFEHFKYALAYAFAVVGPELIPHFGLLADRSTRHAFARNFWDSDQRPYARILANTPADLPVLIINGVDDPLVMPEAARKHHELIKQSELLMISGGHGDIFMAGGVQPIADAVADFLNRKVILDQTAERRTNDPFALEQNHQDDLATSITEPLKLKDIASPWAKMIAIALATFVSEDYTCISVGLLINHGHTDLFLGVLACFLGIFIGDIILFAIGRIAGQRVLGWGPIKKWAPTETVDEIAQWYDRHGFIAVFASRFMPGTRFPLYVTAGVVGSKAHKFIIWAAISDIIYTPIVVILVAVFGDQLAEPLTAFFGQGWIALLVAAALLFLVLRLLIYMLTTDGRRRIKIKLLKMRHHEWWPPYIFYLPMIPVWLYLIARYRSFTCWTAANPAIPDGGIVGESKADILSALPTEAVIPWALLTHDQNDTRMDQFRKVMTENNWSYPIILKPDVGERGTAVRKVNNDNDAASYFHEIPGSIIAQVFDPGPHECGIFYVRPPEENKGYIFAITNKTFPVLEGDGEHTVEQLIHRHPRFRMQSKIFLRRLHAQRHDVLPQGQTLNLTMAGNHAQGCMFTDGAHLYTDILTDAIDKISVAYEGFYFGRFDIRYTDPRALAEGRDIRIVELNGVTSEATNLYDPNWSPIRAYKQLTTQWDWCFKIGRANVDQGHKATSVRTLLGILLGRFVAKPQPMAN